MRNANRLSNLDEETKFGYIQRKEHLPVSWMKNWIDN